MPRWARVALFVVIGLAAGLWAAHGVLALSRPLGVENIPGTKLNRKSDGIELALPKGTSVKSLANGIVKYTGDINGDLTVFVQHGKYFSTYTHLSSINVSVGQEVRAGTLLGKSGINLDGEGALLLMISNEKGIFLDPENWLKNRR